ncbi:MAG: hypothetical protein HXO97_00265 [Streptococcus sp.]|nr:hypothetical protein [Streptococcus sp.]
MFFKKAKIIKEQAEEIAHLKRINEQHNLINRWNIDTIREMQKKVQKMDELLELYKSVIYRENE